MTNFTPLIERFGSLGLLALVIWLGFRFLDKYAGAFGATLGAIQQTLVQHMREDAERHEKLLAALTAAENKSTDDIRRDLDNLKQAWAYARKLSPGQFPAVKIGDPRREGGE